MLRVCLGLILPLLLTAAPAAGQQDSCAEFRQALKSTYNFKPSRLSEADRDAKSAAMDRFWEMVSTRRVQLLPCLRVAIADPQSDSWFLFDGSNLLVSNVPDGERDVVAVLKPEDVPLVRKVRRAMMARANLHAFEFYKTFTDILMTLVWRPELVN
jgi:hypothetical protein